jgi:carboxylate-amine ligase
MVMEPLAHRFGVGPAFQVGLEEELLLVDAENGQLRTDADRVIAAVRPHDGRLVSEIFAAELELVTPICQTVEELGRALAGLLEAAQGAGATLIGSGLHPNTTFGDACLSTSHRYATVSHALQGLLRNPPASLHVHVGMPDPETAIRVSNGLRRRLPLLHSLAANSPFWYGQDSGLASARAAVLRSYPRYGVPRWFRDWDDFSLVARELAQAAGVADYTYFWWDVRPHAVLGTVEVRAPDAQPSVERTLALAALIHALARMEAEAPPPVYQSRDAIEEACYQATRFGLDARLPDESGGLRSARELGEQALHQVRPYARELGCDAQLEAVQRILDEGTGADLQRSIYAHQGMPGLLRWLIGERQDMREAER